MLRLSHRSNISLLRRSFEEGDWRVLFYCDRLFFLVFFFAFVVFVLCRLLRSAQVGLFLRVPLLCLREVHLLIGREAFWFVTNHVCAMHHAWGVEAIQKKSILGKEEGSKGSADNFIIATNAHCAYILLQ